MSASMVVRTMRGLALSILAVSLARCGGGGGGLTTGPTAATPPAPTPNTFPARTFSSLQPERAAFGDYSVNVPGTLQIVADWTSGGNDIDIFVTGTGCSTASYNDLLGGTGACAPLAQAIGVDKPERLNVNAAVGTYRIYVASSFLSGTAETGTLTVTLAR